MIRISAVINLFVPGAGLIVLRREWLGLAVAILFGLLAQIGVVGLLLAPAVVPTWVTHGAFACALVTWLWVQWLVAKRIRTSTGAEVEREVALLCERSDEAIARGNLEEANDLLRAAMEINDEDVALNRKSAELATRRGRDRDALHAWRRVLQLARDAQTKSTAREAISRL